MGGYEAIEFEEENGRAIGMKIKTKKGKKIYDIKASDGDTNIDEKNPENKNDKKRYV
jgi:hypothetical protein